MGSLYVILYWRMEGLYVKISTKGRYALRLMLDLAQVDTDAFTSLKDIAERQNVSKKYLEQIVPMLTRADYLMANRGFQGGYKLTKAPADYTVGQILRLTEGSLAPVACLDHEPIQCDRCEDCITLPLWKGLDKVINEYLDNITLQDLLDNHRERLADDYVI